MPEFDIVKIAVPWPFAAAIVGLLAAGVVWLVFFVRRKRQQ